MEESDQSPGSVVIIVGNYRGLKYQIWVFNHWTWWWFWWLLIDWFLYGNLPCFVRELHLVWIPRDASFSRWSIDLRELDRKGQLIWRYYCNRRLLQDFVVFTNMLRYKRGASLTSLIPCNQDTAWGWQVPEPFLGNMSFHALLSHDYPGCNCRKHWRIHPIFRHIHILCSLVNSLSLSYLLCRRILHLEAEKNIPSRWIFRSKAT